MRIVIAVLLLQFCVLAKSNLNIALPQEVLRTKEELLAPNAGDIQFGNKKAKVRVVVFDSYSCFHCANLYKNIFPMLDKMYIKTGKVLFIHKDFPLDKLALFASKAVHCSQNPIATMHEIYSKQDAFLVENYQQKLLAIKGINYDCIKNFDDKTITKASYEYSKILKITGTPTVYINEKVIENKSKKNFITIIEAEIAKK
jgi:protein-disulfide isomerase